jgi:hypothetical protein
MICYHNGSTLYLSIVLIGQQVKFRKLLQLNCNSLRLTKDSPFSEGMHG